MTNLDFMVEVAATIVETFALLIVNLRLSGVRYTGRKYCLLLLGEGIGYVAVITLMNTVEMFSFVTPMIGALFLTIFSYFTCGRDLLVSITAAVFSIFMIMATDYFLFFTIGMISENPIVDSRSFMLLMSPSPTRRFYLIASKSFQLLLSVCAFRKVPSLKKLRFQYVVVFLIISSVSYVMMTFLVSMVLSSSILVMQTAIIFLWIFIAACVAAALVTCFIASNYRDEKETNRLLSTVNALTEENYQNVCALQNEIAKQTHDFTHHIKALHELLQNNVEEAQKYTSSLLEAALNRVRLCQSGNSTIDAIINGKLWEAKRLQIELDYQVNFSIPTDISPIDICAILANQLDNAFEACMKVEESSERKVNIRIYQQMGNAAIFQVSNTAAKDPFENNKELKSTKEDTIRPHGLGLRSIRDTAEKYEGILENTYQNGRFISSVLLYYTPQVSAES